MTEDEARHVELVRAIEMEDKSNSLLTSEDLAQAETHARMVRNDVGPRRVGEAFVAARAAFASARVETRHLAIAGLIRRSHWPAMLGIVIPLIALILGFVANEFGTGKRLDLLAVPLLGTLLWNVAVYAWVLVSLVRHRTAGGLNLLFGSVLRIRGIGRAAAPHGSTLQRAGAAFEKRWAMASAPLTGARIGRTMHLSAALFACGLIGGIYLRALVIEYRAGWESTFLSPGAVRQILSLVLGPASGITGVSIPSVAGVAAMRWTGPDTGGVNAAPWIFLYTATVVGLVIVPRLMLAFGQGAIALRLARRFPVAGREDFYVRRLLRGAGEVAGKARVTPYAYHPGEDSRRRLTETLRAALGDGAEVRFDEPIDYGKEDEWIKRRVADPSEDYQILLFTLAATPEEENHGALATALAKSIASERSGTVLAAVIDEAPFRARFGSQGGIEERIAGRLLAWRKALARAGIAPIGLDLSQDRSEALAQRLESGLMPDGAMHG